MYTSIKIRKSNLEKIKARATRFNQSIDDLITDMTFITEGMLCQCTNLLITKILIKQLSLKLLYVCGSAFLFLKHGLLFPCIIAANPEILVILRREYLVVVVVLVIVVVVVVVVVQSQEVVVVE